MKHKPFIIYNIVLFVAFFLITMFSISEITIGEDYELVLFSFGLTGILIQSYVINKKLSE